MRVFIGSSTEGLELARSIQEELGLILQEKLDKGATIILWNQGVFRPGQYALERLIELANDYDFAIFVISPDDIAEVRGNRVLVARDNVLFEAGLFFSQLDRIRTFLIKPRIHSTSSEPPFHLPSDLQGLTLVEYSPPDNPADLRAAIGGPCNQIANAIHGLGPRRVGEALQKIDLLSGGPIFLLRHVELRTHKLSELACILRYFNDAEVDTCIAWPKAAQYAVQTLSVLGLIGFAADEAYINDPGKEFLAHPRVKNRFNNEFERNLCPEEKKTTSMRNEFQQTEEAGIRSQADLPPCEKSRNGGCPK
jgi:Predicted nucleotide-binding protein containing TIR-like domain